MISYNNCRLGVVDKQILLQFKTICYYDRENNDEFL